ncbi:hypothetical protein LVO79_18865 (plasmid) [Roseivivax marinus]|nr:hypothetical protein [Roseivivax marinus]UMA67075.1 hypothetical protein LVO79_18865 [Roseivivax marinus]
MPEHTYIITSTAANLVGEINVPVGAQKLLMALLREQDREQRGWLTIASLALAERLCHRTLDVLRALGCAPRGGNARFFARAVDALADIPDLFDNIELSRDARILSWSFADPFLQAMERTEAYGLIDPTEIKLLTGKWDPARFSSSHRRACGRPGPSDASARTPKSFASPPCPIAFLTPTAKNSFGSD